MNPRLLKTKNSLLAVYIPDCELNVFCDMIYLFGSHDRECVEDIAKWAILLAGLHILRYFRLGVTTVQFTAVSSIPMQRGVHGYAPVVVQGHEGRFYLYYMLSVLAEAGYTVHRCCMRHSVR